MSGGAGRIGKAGGMSKPEYEVRRGCCSYIIHDKGQKRITNFVRAYLGLYSEAVKIYNRAHHGRILTIRKSAPYCYNGQDVLDFNRYEPSNSLWAPEDVEDLADFWRILESLKEKEHYGEEENAGA